MSGHLERVQDWVSLAQTARYRVEDLAALCSVSRRQLERQFAKRLGTPPHAWLNDLRLGRACELLLHGYYVKAAALEVGFRDASHFCRAFKLRYGVTPRAFVAQQAKKVAFRK